MGCLQSTGPLGNNNSKNGISIVPEDEVTYSEVLNSEIPYKKFLFKFILLGDCGVGKTTLLNQYVHKQASEIEYKATIGADFLTKEIQLNDHVATLQIWDTAGQERFQSLAKSFYRGADCVLLVFDVNSLKSFQNLDKWRNDFLTNALTAAPEEFPFLVLGNKCDLNLGEKVPQAQIQAYCQKINAVYFETSARKSINVDKAFATAAIKILKRISNAKVDNQY